ncbi:hypothetical protein ACFVVK_13660, partial [Arthrobacter sp. NPDC058192]
METARDFIPFGDDGQGTGRGAERGTNPARLSGVDAALAVLRAAVSAAAVDAGSWGFRAAAEFAGQVEELSRTLEYGQLIAAAAVDRARKQSVAAAAAVTSGTTGWTTGWRDDAAAGAGREVAAGGAVAAGEGASSGWSGDVPGSEAGTAGGAGSGAGGGVPAAAGSGGGPDAADVAAADDGYRNTVEFLRASLRIGAPEARRRLVLAGRLLPRQGLAGRQEPPVHEELGAAVAAGEVGSRAA